MNISVKNVNSVINTYKRNGIPFRMEKSMFTTKIYGKFSTMVNHQRTDLVFSELMFFQKIKHHAKLLAEKKLIPAIDRKKINYIHSKNFKNKYSIRNCYEIDLTGAYFEFANNFGYLTPELYNEGLKQRKKVRLMALGILAKRICIMNFDGRKFLKPEYIDSTDTEGIFFHVSLETDLLMKNLQILAGKEFLFFWVDAIFVRDEKTKIIICEYLNELQIKHKEKKLQRLTVAGKKIIIDDYEKDEPRTFNF